MKNNGKFKFVTGFVCGALVFGSLSVYAADVIAKQSTAKMLVNSKAVNVAGYNINGSNYYQLRDLSNVLGFGVSFDDKTNTISIESQKTQAATAPINSPTPTVAPTFRIGEKIKTNDFELTVTKAISTKEMTFESGGKIDAKEGKTYYMVYFDVLTKNTPRSGRFWTPGDFVRGIVASDGVKYDGMSSWGEEIYPNQLTSVNTFLEIEDTDNIKTVTISDGNSNQFIVNVN